MSGVESPNRGGAQPGAVFLSYASQDADAAERICAALRAHGIEVWFDQSELRGGDVWDQRIRREIHDCALFIPIVSQCTQQRLEGYFRREWKLAVERTHDMAEQKPFLVPVVVDGTTDRDAVVPDPFRAVQWTRLPGGQTPASFVDRIQRLLSPAPAAATRAPATVQPAYAAGTAARASGGSKRFALGAIALAVLGVLGFAFERFWVAKPATQAPAVPVNPAAGTFNPPPHSVAVLPFVNMSGDKDQEYFSEGLTEEILNSLTEINQLQVAGRTSAFSFQGKDADISTIARKLNVGAVLEGSVRRSGHTVRITAQLVNASTGFHMWSKSYDRDLGDVLKLQTEIATAVAGALKVTLLGNEAAKIELGGTRNPEALDAFLRGAKAFRSGEGAASYQKAIADLTEAIRLDPDYALAFAGRSLALSNYAGEFANGAGIGEFYARAESDARQAVKLAPDLAEAHLALARYLSSKPLDYARASEAYQRAMALAPGDTEVLGGGGLFAVFTGHFDAGLAATRKAVALDPLNPQTHESLGEALFWSRHYQEAVDSFSQVISLQPDFRRAYGFRGVSYYLMGNFPQAASSCETAPEHWSSMWCLALTYQKLGRRGDAAAELQRIMAKFGDASAYQNATIYAQWGDSAKALEWLERAVRLPDTGVVYLKTDPLMDPLRGSARFQKILQELRFPD